VPLSVSEVTDPNEPEPVEPFAQFRFVEEAVACCAAAFATAATSTEYDDNGASTTRAISNIESVPGIMDEGIVNVTGITTATPGRALVTSVALIALAGIEPNAFAEGAVTNESVPKLNAETATSAMRLRVIFVDICFLSLVVEKTFFSTAGKERLLAS